MLFAYRYKMIQVVVVGGFQPQGLEANVIKGLVVEAKCHVRILDQLVGRQDRIIGLYNDF